MNLTQSLQELDDLIVEHTKPPVTAMLRNKLHPILEQMEAHLNPKNNLALGELVLNDGVMWKRNATGFESRPYCPECPNHPGMMGFPPGGKDMWACPHNHTFDYASKPPAA